MSTGSTLGPTPAGLAQLGRVHFLGLAGVGVSAVARLMLAAGVPISGTDAKELPVLDEFRAAGVPVRVGYSAENIASVEAETGQRISTVIASSVATAGNPEYDAAAAAGARLLHRSEGLAACMASRRAIAVAGTHGKTTTSSMTAVMFSELGLDPSFAIGATVAGLGSNAKLGTGEWFVAEADESDGSLLNYTPEVAVVTNVEPDHLDHYGTAEAVERVFEEFTERITSGGALVLCLDDAGAAALLDRVRDQLTHRRIRILTYGTHPEASLRLRDISTSGAGQSAILSLPGEQATLALPVPGLHNALNAAAAVAAGIAAGLRLGDCTAAVGQFTGSSRRFELRGEAAGVLVYDDYAHHPTEVAAVLAAARSAAPGKVHAVFQPHLFSRTRDFAAEFGRQLSAADTVTVLEIYPAREQPIAGVSAELLGHPVLQPQEAAAAVAAAAEPGDMVLTIGAGDITHLGPQILAALQERQ
ncbi:UDP-N-acetylmuramate--L-alanine ligase [Nesterenkonia alkaliphila]|uniref:UDP-N-acetylmuramate--L-alanine ligase n=1 Tax=Nesterenkonia alkaliphila TaxID=1463631 RepID=A0A7K1UG53_9MICC|nr:UDP-N-acetylmuramate--L-alanine ligase [Nesterenkonia alkaliphila]MVT25450.1 UDP-N-acetylmuramate--L-alanine ligase [Nesterenkonia alkaliphila]GFZ83853.1 UDP-N-acetylmuramate--L-alanine ligase [Nesterenkonia alkaliphila]